MSDASQVIIDCETGEAVVVPLTSDEMAAQQAAASAASQAQQAINAAAAAQAQAMATIANMRDNADPNVSALAKAVHTLLGGT